jgi:RNA polymerase sigma factor (sigma-70 family)
MDSDRTGVGQLQDEKRPNGSTGQDLCDLQRFFPLVNAIARRTLRGELPTFDYGDAVATGLLALVKSERRVNAGERGFVSYASQRVRGAILDAIRELHAGSLVTVSLSSGGGYDGNGRVAPLDVPDSSRYASPELVVDRSESVQALREAMKLLRPREQQVLVLRYWQEETTRSVAKKMHVSPTRVSQLEKRARERLRGLLTDGNGGAWAAA